MQYSYVQRASRYPSFLDSWQWQCRNVRLFFPSSIFFSVGFSKNVKRHFPIPNGYGISSKNPWFWRKKGSLPYLAKQSSMKKWTAHQADPNENIFGRCANKDIDLYFLRFLISRIFFEKNISSSLADSRCRVVAQHILVYEPTGLRILWRKKIWEIFCWNHPHDQICFQEWWFMNTIK